MPTTKIPLPEDPGQRRLFLQGMTSAHQGWSEADVLAARPLLSPQSDIFDAGRALGLDMASRNLTRRRNLQKGVRGLFWRVFQKRDDEKARKDAIPELP